MIGVLRARMSAEPAALRERSVPAEPLPETGAVAGPDPARELPDPSTGSQSAPLPGEGASRPRRAGAVPTSLVIALASLLAFSAVTLFFGTYAFALSGLQEQRSQHQLYAEFRGLLDPSSEVVPRIGGAIPPGTPIALLNSSKAGLHDVMVVEGTSSSDLLAGPGHLRDSPLPGQVGESVLMGKSATAGAPFAGITNLRKGDLITVVTGQGKFRYVVQDEILGGQKLPEVPVDGSLLTLITSAGSGGLGGLLPNHLVYVNAKLAGKTVNAPSGRPISVLPAEVQGQGDTGAWPFVIFWLQGLLVASIGAVWLWNRWGRVQAWLVGAPVLFAILWALSTEALRLLPNVY